MNRAVRHRLTILFLGAFDDPEKREAILRLALFFELVGHGGASRVPVADFDAAWAQHHPEHAACSSGECDATAPLRGLVEMREAASGAAGVGGKRGPQTSAVLWYELHPDVVPFVTVVAQCVRTYARILPIDTEEWNTLRRLEPLRSGVAVAAACFNAGLFFEAHEHLEGQWRSLAPSPTKRFVQGLIQVCVGFHHAMRGSYQGAVNQLGKGLAKLVDAPDGALGLDCSRFAREVERIRGDIVTRGRQQMRAPELRELPRMHLLQ